MRKILFVTYLTKSCLRVYISQLENTPLNVHKNRLKDSLTSGNSIFSFCKTAGQSGFHFFLNQRNNGVLRLAHLRAFILGGQPRPSNVPKIAQIGLETSIFLA